MRATYRWVATCVSLVASVAQAQPGRSTGGTAAARIIVGPEIPVSSDGDVPHVELMVAANPRDAHGLVGAAITGTKRFGGMANKIYTSSDGGFTWIDVELPEQRAFGSGDPQVAFGTSGTAYFASLTNKFDTASKRDRVGLFVYRSADGGFTWNKPIDLGFGYDHEQIVVDQSGRFNGRVYLGALYGYPVYRVGVFRSTDDGRSFVGPVEVANGKGDYGINVVNLLVFSDGTLFVPFADFEFKPEKRKANPHSNFWFATSRDGGETFSPAKKLFQQMRGDRDSLHLTTFPVFAVDNNSSDHRDRLYLVWTDFRFGRARLLFSSSSDRGEHWSEPRLLDPTTPPSADQYQPAMTVSKDGTVGVTWFDSRGLSDGHHYHEYFTASVDGGGTFLPPHRVSNVPSNALGPGNVALYPGEFRYPADSLRINLLSAADRWGNGGDYMGLTVDQNGVFHPWWADSRSGTFQIYTAGVRVEHIATEVAQAAQWAREVLTPSVHLVFGLGTYDTVTRTFVLPVSLRNDGARPIRGPLTVEITGFGSGTVGEGIDREFAPAIANAANGKPGDGATFEYGNALGDAMMLEPGAQSAPVVWRLRTKDPLRLPNMHVTITGQVPR